ncbi:MAG TPA: energy transducer TonB, partial [Vicinamibacteria bacterium]
GTTFAAPESPRYKSTTAPEELPWPTSVLVPPYPMNAVGSGKVILEADVSDSGTVTAARILTEPTPVDSGSSDTLRQWKFRPASRGNRDVASRVFVVFSFVGTTP